MWFLTSKKTPFGLTLYGRRNGETANGELSSYYWRINPTYLAQPRAQPVSLTLPLRAEPYRSTIIPPFFSGLLAEGALATTQCRTLRVDEHDTFGRIIETCRDTIGAVTVEPLP